MLPLVSLVAFLGSSSYFLGLSFILCTVHFVMSKLSLVLNNSPLGSLLSVQVPINFAACSCEIGLPLYEFGNIRSLPR